MRHLLQVAVVWSVFVASACISVGDALLTIRGRLVMPGGSAEKCRLTLSLATQGTPQPSEYYSRTIGVGFSENFTVEPAVKDYRVVINCPGYEIVERTVQSTRSVARIDLEEIMLVRSK
jgi:hypothetical protein